MGLTVRWSRTLDRVPHTGVSPGRRLGIEGILVHRTAEPHLQMLAHDAGVVLRAGGGRVDLVVAAIRDDNPDADLHVIDHGDIVQVWAQHLLRLTARSLRWHVGWDLAAHDLWSMIVLFHGAVTATAHCVTVTSGPIAAS
jgi:hypothetical protein